MKNRATVRMPTESLDPSEPIRVSRRVRMGQPALPASAGGISVIGALLFLVGLITREKVNPYAVSSHSIWAWIYLVLIGAIIGFSAYIYLLRHCDPAKVATYAYVNPVVALFIGAVAGETLNPRELLAALVIVVAELEATWIVPPLTATAFWA